MVARTGVEPVIAFGRVGWKEHGTYRWIDASVLDLDRSEREWSLARPWLVLNTNPLQGRTFGPLPGIRVPPSSRLLLVFVWNTGCLSCRRSLVGMRAVATTCPAVASSTSIATVCIGNSRASWATAVKATGGGKGASVDTYLEPGDAPWLEQALQGRAADSFLVDSSGRVVASRFGPELLTRVVEQALGR